MQSMITVKDFKALAKSADELEITRCGKLLTLSFVSGEFTKVRSEQTITFQSNVENNFDYRVVSSYELLIAIKELLSFVPAKAKISFFVSHNISWEHKEVESYKIDLVIDKPARNGGYTRHYVSIGWRMIEAHLSKKLPLILS